jgi:hypothetical protein
MGNMKPTYLHDAEGFRDAVKIGSTPESIYLDFKAMVADKAQDGDKEVARDIAQFANSDGGVLLIGVAERKDPSNGMKVADAIKPIADVDTLVQRIEQAITNFLVPSTFRPQMVPIVLSEGTVLAINIEPSRHLVYVSERAGQKHIIECICRTNHGKEWMNPDEMEQHMMNGSRAARLAFRDARSTSKGKDVEVMGGVWEYRSHVLRQFQTSFIGSLSSEQDGWFDLEGSVSPSNPPQRCAVTIPFDLVRAVWVGREGRLTMMLSARLLFGDGRFTLEPHG